MQTQTVQNYNILLSEDKKSFNLTNPLNCRVFIESDDSSLDFETYPDEGNNSLFCQITSNNLVFLSHFISEQNDPRGRIQLHYVNGSNDITLAYFNNVPKPVIQAIFTMAQANENEENNNGNTNENNNVSNIINNNGNTYENNNVSNLENNPNSNSNNTVYISNNNNPTTGGRKRKTRKISKKKSKKSRKSRNY
jgi:hypothetical protein